MKRLRNYDGEDDVDAFLPKQCCKRKERYDREIDLSVVGTVSNEQEELGVLYSDVSNILRKYDSIQIIDPEQKLSGIFHLSDIRNRYILIIPSHIVPYHSNWFP